MEWVELRRYDDAIEAEIALSFLRNHGVRVALQGNSGATSVLNRFATVLDIRLVVPPGELDHAREVLFAMTAADAVVEPAPELEEEGLGGGPYRRSRTLGRRVEPRPRSRLLAWATAAMAIWLLLMLFFR